MPVFLSKLFNVCWTLVPGDKSMQLDNFIFYFKPLLFLLYLQELGLIRKPASFMTSICDERGQELLYAGIPITDIFKEDMGIGGVLSLLWFQRRYVAEY